MDFNKTLSIWYRENRRELPWRRTKDPYNIWLSEIILQQTRVVQGKPYYRRFISRYPTIFDLADASEEEVLKLWQGLGYYSRARNLHKTAQIVAKKFGGVFPDNYNDLLKLKGVGDYTASAVSSICFGEPRAVLDGNVFRVLSRFFGIEEPINSTAGRKIFKAKADVLLDRSNPGRHNQALMEFGAIQCKPKQPLCGSCPLRLECVAFQQGKVNVLPKKIKKIRMKKRYLNFFVFKSAQGETIIQKRSEKGIWRNLYQFPMVEATHRATYIDLSERETLKDWNLNTREVVPFSHRPVKHQLTHQTLLVQFWIVKTNDVKDIPLSADMKIVKMEELEQYPVPAIIAQFLENFESTN